MNKIWLTLIFVIALAFALPALLAAFESIIPAVLTFVVLAAVGTMLFKRRRRW